MYDSEVLELLEKVRQLSIKMRFLKTLLGADSEVSELKEREILLLELIDSHGPITVTEIRKHFPNLGPGTISGDLKKLRLDLGYIEKKVGRADQRTNLVELTQKGAEKIKEINMKRLQVYQPLKDCFQEKPETVEILSDLLDLAINKVSLEINKFSMPQK